MQTPAIQFLPSLVTEDDDKVEEDDVDDKKEVGYAEEKFHLSGGGGCSKQSKGTKNQNLTGCSRLLTWMVHNMVNMGI
eukprot:scaffold478_cov63-Cyclotella_meneghiniana.AAC.1